VGHPAPLHRSDQWPGPRKTNPIGATYWLAIFSGAVALYLFIASAAKVSQPLSVGFNHP
jgi:hypothetical protein